MTELENRIENVINTYIQEYQGLIFSQIYQDIVALTIYNIKQSGFFVEIGTMGGKDYSNTYLLEQGYGWRGIVAECGRMFHEELAQNRSCIIDHRAVADVSGKSLHFQEIQSQTGLSGLIDYFDENEMHAGTRAANPGNVYEVTTVSLNDLLDQHSAPSWIDYMSIDTEGSEYAILNTFDFDRHRVGLFTVEHNYFEPKRSMIKALMEQHGYTHILPHISNIDDWFVDNQLL